MNGMPVTPFADSRDLFMRDEDQSLTPTVSLHRSSSSIFPRSFSTRSTDQLINVGDRSSLSPELPRSFSTRSTDQLINIGERSSFSPKSPELQSPYTDLSPGSPDTASDTESFRGLHKGSSTQSTEQLIRAENGYSSEADSVQSPGGLSRSFSTRSTEQLIRVENGYSSEADSVQSPGGLSRSFLTEAQSPGGLSRGFSTRSTERLTSVGEVSQDTTLRNKYTQQPAVLEVEHLAENAEKRWKKYYNAVTKNIKEVGQYVYLLLAVYGIPIALAAFLPSVRPILFWIGSSSIFITTGWLISEALASFKSWGDSRKLHLQPLPNNLPLNVAAIISAYLPNEIGVIRETIDAVSSLNLPIGGRMKVVVAHNGGSKEDIEKLSIIIDDILVSLSVEIQNLYVVTSHSKAENVNAAIKHLSEQIKPQVCVMYDADHRPDINAMAYALHSMTVRKADLLQGRCVIARGSPLLAAEFDTIYGINHAGGSVLRGFAFFGGTNGYWNFNLLTRIGMDETMLTEDIDSSFRSLAKGAKVIFDPKVTSYEEAPDSVNSLMKQRLRWAQGWSQVAVRHLSLLGNEDLSPYKRLMVFMVLHWREIFYYLTPLTLPAAVASFVNKSKFAFPLIAVTVIQMGVPPLLAILARYHVRSDRHPNLGPRQYIIYLIVAPVYDSVKNAVCVLGHFRNVCNMTKWRVTSRSTKTVEV